MVHRFAATVGEAQHEVTVEPLEGGAYRVVVDGRERVLDARQVEPGAWSLRSAVNASRSSLVNSSG